MKKLVIAFVFATLFTVLPFFAHAAYVPETGDGYISFDYNVVANGMVNGVKTAVLERNVPFEGREAVRFTPTPELDTVASSYTLDCFVIANYSVKVEMPKYKYIGVTYYYDSDFPTFTGKMYMSVIKPALGKYIYSNKEIVTGQWTEAYFDMSDLVLPSSDSQIYFKQFHFRPFGSIAPQKLSANDVLYIEKITFYETNPDPETKNSVRFTKNTPEAVGEEIELLLDNETEIVIPESPFVYKNADFVGWKNLLTGEMVYPDDMLENPGHDLVYVAQWRVNLIVPDNLTFVYPDYCNGIVNDSDTGFWEKVEFDGRYVVKITPNTESEINKTLYMDGFTYNKAKYGIDLTQYKYMTIEYYYDTQKPSTKKMRMEFLTGSNKVLTSRYNMNAADDYEIGKWATMTFDISGVSSYLNPAVWPQTLFQTHFAPFGYIGVHDLSADDAMYISHITFSKEKPDFETRQHYMQGFEDGTFRPGNFFTRAEACAAVSRLIEDEADISGMATYDDVTPDAWYWKYIGFLYEKGLLSEFDESLFLPDSPVTSSELSKLCIDAYAYKYGKTLASDTGVLPMPENGNVPVIREQAVTVINTVFDRYAQMSMLPEELTVLYTDIDFRHPKFAQIASATVSRIESYKDWVLMLEDPMEKLGDNAEKSLDARISVGNAKVAELDILEEQRISAIRCSESMDLSGITGKKIYVSSSSGDDSYSGLNASAPVATIARANELAQSGDAVLLMRDDLWREKFTAVAGVIYSAYGNGAKPRIYGSPENGADASKWTLAYSDEVSGAKIWQYAQTDFTDVGMIVFNGGEGFARKEIPSCVQDKFYLRGQESLAEEERTPFDYRVQLDYDLEFFHAANSKVSNNIININYAKGSLYLRCDKGNPGDVFDSIEFSTRVSVIGGRNGNVFDNLCIMYGGGHGIGIGGVKNIAVRNCEIGWIGGSIQMYNGNGSVTRFGNGVEVYGSCDGYTIENCYIYECYDAGITHQYSGSSEGDCIESNILYQNNVIVDCVYNIEYFLGAQSAQANTVRRGDNVVIEGNLLRRAGYGFGSVRPDANNQRHIRSGTSRNEFTNFVIRNNIFDRAVHELCQTYTSFEITAPKYEGNIYIQGIGNRLFHHGKNHTAYMDINAPYAVKEVLGDRSGVIYYTEYIPKYEYKYTAYSGS